MAVQRVMIRTPEGEREYKYIPDSDAYEAACSAGDISVGEDIVYREFIVHILPDYQMMLLTRIGSLFMWNTGGQNGQ